VLLDAPAQEVLGLDDLIEVLAPVLDAVANQLASDLKVKRHNYLFDKNTQNFF
jgi:hypothetical protein